MWHEDMGGSAFPRPVSVTHGGVRDRQALVPEQDGMTLWDYYAAAALTGLIAEGPHDCGPKEIAHDVGLYADAMLIERQKRMGGGDAA